MDVLPVHTTNNPSHHHNSRPWLLHSQHSRCSPPNLQIYILYQNFLPLKLWHHTEQLSQTVQWFWKLPLSLLPSLLSLCCHQCTGSIELHGARWLAEAQRRHRRTNQRGPRWDFSIYFSGRLRGSSSSSSSRACVWERKSVFLSEETSWEQLRKHEIASSWWVTLPTPFLLV